MNNQYFRYLALGLVSVLLSACGGSDSTNSSSGDTSSTSSSLVSSLSSSSFSSSSLSSSSSSSSSNISSASSSQSAGEEQSGFNSRNVPRDGKIAFFMGQDSDTLRDYKVEVLDSSNDMPAPGGVTLYTSVLPTEFFSNSAPGDAAYYMGGIEGVPANLDNGDVNFYQTLQDYDQVNAQATALAVGLYLSDEWVEGDGRCANQPLRAIINNGDADLGSINDPSSLTYQWRYAMDRMILWFKQQNRPVYLRIGYEFDGPWNCYSQDYYKRAFRYLKSRIDALGADNVATVWQAATYPDNGSAQYNYNLTDNGGDLAQSVHSHYNDWFPGEDVVDWVGISFFAGEQYLQYQWSCQDAAKEWTVPDLSPRFLQNALVDFAKSHNKPVMIAESAPQGMNLSELSWSCVAARQDAQAGHQFSSGQQAWDAFFKDYFQWIESKRDTVRAVAYINTDWQQQSRWFCAENATSCAQGYWGNTSVQDNPQILELLKQTLNQELFTWNGSVYGAEQGGPGSGHSSSSNSSASVSSASSISSESSQEQSSSEQNSSNGGNTGNNMCPVSHPFWSTQCNQCFTDQQQAISAGCGDGSVQSSSPNNNPPPNSGGGGTWPETDIPVVDRSAAFDLEGGTWLEQGVLVSRVAERYRVRHELSTDNFNNYNVEYWVGRYGWFELRDYSREQARPLRAGACGNDQPCVVVTLYGAVPAAMTDADGNNKDCNQQVPNWRYHKHYGNETDFYYGYVMDLVQEDGSVVPACQASLAQRSEATVWRAVMRPDVNIPRGFAQGDQIEFETTINFNRAQTFGDNVNYYGQTFRYVLGEGFTVNNQDSNIGPLAINDDFAQLGGATTVPQLSASGGQQQRLAYMQHAYNMGPEHIQDFLVGRRLIHSDFNNGHHVEQFLPGPQASGGNLPFDELAGLATDPIQASCTQCHFLNGSGSLQQGQDVVPPRMIGLGLLEAISDDQILAWAKENGGRVNMVDHQGEQKVGRFGWRAETFSLRQQVAKALKQDMGVGSSFPGFGPSEIDEQLVDQMQTYVSLVAVPTPRENLTELPGHQIFQDLGCNDCHKMTVRTGDHDKAELSQQIIHPYTDLLLHDLGEGEYRTAPLWGIGLSAYVQTGNSEDFALMHDGLSPSLDHAIKRHGPWADAYNGLGSSEQQALIRYLKAL